MSDSLGLQQSKLNGEAKRVRIAFGSFIYRVMSLVDVILVAGLIWVVADGLLGIETRPWMLILAVLVGIAVTERQLRLRGPRQVRLLGLIPLAPRRWFSNLTPTVEGRCADRNPTR